MNIWQKFLKWLRSAPSAAPATRPDVFDPQQRLIFRYSNGRFDEASRWVLADPLPLHKRVMDAGPELDTLIKVSQSESKDAGKANVELCAKLRELFDIAPLDGPFKLPPEGTLTDTEVSQLLDKFLWFCDGVKKNSPTTPTCAAAPPPSTVPTSADPSPTPSGSGSGSTDAGPSSAPPGPSPTGPGSPSGS